MLVWTKQEIENVARSNNTKPDQNYLNYLFKLRSVFILGRGPTLASTGGSSVSAECLLIILTCS